jgi:hypothetical protein
MRAGATVRAAVRALRYDPDRVPEPGSEGVAAAVVGLLVLAGAIGTYFAVVGGLGPLVADPPAGGGPPPVVELRTP